MKRFFALLSALLLLFPAALCFGAAEAEAPHYTLPLDFSPGNPVNQKYYLSDTVYEDPTLKVVISTGDYEGVLYWIADIEIQDASQLRTAAAAGFDSRGSEFGSVLAKRMNAVVAVDGDYYCYSRGVPLVIRQGRVFLNELRFRGRHHDVLLIDENGDFIGLENPKEEDINAALNSRRIINGFYFGPLLVNNGTIATEDNTTLGKNQFSQRVAIAQIDHLKYRIIVTGPSKRGSKAFLFDDWREFVAGMSDIKVAYNLDGGDSSVLVFNNKKINDPDNTNERPLADIIYFASAWPGE